MLQWGRPNTSWLCIGRSSGWCVVGVASKPPFAITCLMTRCAVLARKFGVVSPQWLVVGGCASLRADTAGPGDGQGGCVVFSWHTVLDDDDAVLDADLAVSLGFASRLNTARVHRRSLMPQHTPSCPCHGCPRRMHASLSPRYSAACHKYRYRMRCIFGEPVKPVKPPHASARAVGASRGLLCRAAPRGTAH